MNCWSGAPTMPAIGAQVPADGAAQSGKAAGLGIAQRHAARAAPVARHHPRPQRHREGVERWHADDAGARRLGVIEARETAVRDLGAERGAARRQAGHLGGCRRRGGRRRDMVADTGARPDMRADKPLGGCATAPATTPSRSVARMWRCWSTPIPDLRRRRPSPIARCWPNTASRISRKAAPTGSLSRPGRSPRPCRSTWQGGGQDCMIPLWRRMLEMRAVDIARPDVLYLGGISRSLQVARMAANGLLAGHDALRKPVAGDAVHDAPPAGDPGCGQVSGMLGRGRGLLPLAAGPARDPPLPHRRWQGGGRRRAVPGSRSRPTGWRGPAVRASDPA